MFIQGHRYHKNKTSSVFKLTIVMLVIIVMCVVTAVLASIFLKPQRIAERELEKIAHDYYETYYYNAIVDGQNKDNAQAFEQFTTNGLPTVYLRELLLFDNQKHIDSEQIFNNQHYYCDPNATSVKYFPVAPYGPKDYTVTYNYSCQEP